MLHLYDPVDWSEFDRVVDALDDRFYDLLWNAYIHCDADTLLWLASESVGQKQSILTYFHNIMWLYNETRNDLKELRSLLLS